MSSTDRAEVLRVPAARAAQESWAVSAVSNTEIPRVQALTAVHKKGESSQYISWYILLKYHIAIDSEHVIRLSLGKLLVNL